MLPDGEVLGSAEHDWDAVFAMLRRSGWRLTTVDGHSSLPPTKRGLAEFESFAVWPVDGVRVNFFPGPDGVYFDVDLRELVNQTRLDVIADVMRMLGTTLHRDVVIRDEGSTGAPLIRYTAASNKFVFTQLNGTTQM
ncbi:hypothetical protein J2T10_004170 [Paenarthrobacter nicotinovorans]|uniref:Uncharacterized protein n=1 Tax=Paenarthrobacter nicotinovorans TaxID=29320 RepID=A0ABT9TS36_PAENI|nr:hypothetical protein [Paenarthrobacter nicotinovorans]MDQ0104495.1 hypothetical protein [Paenarthrobacter nicotinovorans]